MAAAWWQQIIPSVAKVVRDQTPYILNVTKEVFGDFYSSSVRELLNPQISTFTPLRNKDLLIDFKDAAIHCDDIYRGVDHLDGHEVLSIGEDDKPDSVVYFKKDGTIRRFSNTESGTLWVIVRGTETLDDLLSDLGWIASITQMESKLLPGDEFEFPTKVAIKAESIFRRLLEYIQNSEANCSRYPKKKITRICFTGHSLGGAIATALHVLYSSFRDKYSMSIDTGYSFDPPTDRYAPPPCETFTVGAPLVFHSSPLVLLNCPAHRYATSLHNLVYQLDPVPRLLGPHPLPPYLLLSGVEKFIRDFQLFVDRGNYHPYGNYHILLQESRREKLDPNILTVPSSEQVLPVLAAFPVNLRYYLYSAANDHLVIHTVDTIKEYILLHHI